MTKPNKRAVRSLHTALSEYADEELIAAVGKAITKWRKKNMTHQAQNIAVTGSLLWHVAEAVKLAFPDPDAGLSAIGTIGEYLTDMLDVLQKDDDAERTTH